MVLASALVAQTFEVLASSVAAYAVVAYVEMASVGMAFAVLPSVEGTSVKGAFVEVVQAGGPFAESVQTVVACLEVGFAERSSLDAACAEVASACDAPASDEKAFVGETYVELGYFVGAWDADSFAGVTSAVGVVDAVGNLLVAEVTFVVAGISVAVASVVGTYAAVVLFVPVSVVVA